MNLRAEVYSSGQLKSLLNDSRISMIYVPLRLAGLVGEKDRVVLVPPVYLADCEDKTVRELKKLRSQGFGKALAHTVGHIELLDAAGFEIYGGVRLNCANSDSLAMLSEYGVKDAIVSAELSAGQINRLKKPFPIGFISYGYLPLMITRRCPISNGKPCGKERCGKTVTDRMNRRMNVICSENTAEILNSEILDLGDKQECFENADFSVLKFTVETETDPVVSAYCSGRRTENTSFTRGLYFRGLQK